MTKELVPVAGLNPDLRRMFALHDLHVIKGVVTTQAELDDYATQQMHAAIGESARETIAHPLHARLEELEKQVKAPAPTRQMNIRQHVAQKIAPEPRTGATPGPDPTRLTKVLARRYHPDTHTGSTNIGSLTRITQALGISQADFFQATALELTHTADPTAEVSDLELQRYQAWLGLQHGQRSKFTSREEVDAAIAKEKQCLAAEQPFGIAQRSFSLAVQLLGVQGKTGRITRLGGVDAERTAQQLQNAAQYLAKPSMEKHIGADTDPEVQKRLAILVDDLAKVCKIFVATPEASRAHLGNRYGWNAMLAYVGHDFQAVVDRLRRIAEPVIELDSPDFFRSALLRAIREQSDQGGSIMYGTKPTSGYTHYNPPTKRPYNNEPYENPYM